jgi:hypothetical protein
VKVDNLEVVSTGPVHRKAGHTEHVSRSLFQPKDLLVLQRIPEPHQQSTATLQTIKWIAICNLQASRQSLNVKPL